MIHIVLRRGIEVLGQWALDTLPELITVGSDEGDTIRVLGDDIFATHFQIERSFGGECTIVDRRDSRLQGQGRTGNQRERKDRCILFDTRQMQIL